MDRDTAVAAIARRLGRRGTVLDPDIVLEIQEAVKDLEARPELPWFLIHNATGTVLTSAKTIATPTGYLMDDELGGGLWVTSSTGLATPLGKRLYRDAKTNEEAFYKTAGDPEVYAIQGSLAHLFPVPSSDRTYEWWYYRKDPTLLATNVENLWLLHASAVVISLTGLLMAGVIRDKDAKDMFAAMFNTSYTQLLYQTTIRVQQNLDSRIGG